MLKSFSFFNAALPAGATTAFATFNVEPEAIAFVRFIGCGKLVAGGPVLIFQSNGQQVECTLGDAHAPFPVYYNAETGLYESPIKLEGRVVMSVRNDLGAPYAVNIGVFIDIQPRLVNSV